MKTFKDLLIELNACNLAMLWAGNKTIEQVVRDVNRGDWLLWLAFKIDIPLKELTLAKALCAKTVIPLMKDERSKNAIKVAEDFGNGLTSLEALKDAADSAFDVTLYEDLDWPFYNAAISAHAAASTKAHPSAAAYAAYAVGKSSENYLGNQRETAQICKDVLGELIINRVNKLLS